MTSRNKMPLLDPSVRKTTFDEVAVGYTEETAIAEAKRCLHCKNPSCTGGCPVKIHIPDFIAEVAKGDFEKAYEIIVSSNKLPSVTGRVCPQETQCESKCVLGIKGEPVAIGNLERFVADRHAEVVRKAACKDGSVCSFGADCGACANNGACEKKTDGLDEADGCFDENLPKINLADKNIKKEIRYAMNNAFGFGGTNTVMILGKNNFPISKMLPHEFPMVLIDEIIEVNFEKNYLRAKVKIKEGMPFFDKTTNGISSIAGIEFMAQTIGCYSYLKSGENEPKMGFLLGTRMYNNIVEQYENGKEYFIKVEEIYNDNKICAFGCQIFNDKQEEIACATINAYQPDNIEEILKENE